jgi:O-antigen ligase
MSATDIAWSKPASIRSAERDRIASFALAAVLIAFTLTTLDGGEAASQLLSAVFLAGTAVYLVLPPVLGLAFKVPAVCLGAMAAYGLVQTVLLPQKAVYEAWTGVLFWLTAAAITFLSAQVFKDSRRAFQFRRIFVVFGSALCVLELLEQASRTGAYFWVIPSKYPAVYGSFAYWNNFAEFVEILLPVTLWMGFSPRRPDLTYLLLGAVQIGAVTASGSRAGAVLVMAELVCLLVLFSLKNRNRTFLYAAAATVVLTVVFVYSAGVSEVIQKLHQRDQLSVRRDINASSLAMIAERPLMGWGLNSYVPVYPRFARYDAGTIVNRAHNDWLQWTAEGGVFFALAMLVVAGWSVRPAIRSGWGIGLIAVCLHAIVDYPFARLGVCGWYFALLGMLSVWRPHGERRRGSRSEGREAV